MSDRVVRRWVWACQGRNGQWWVDQFDANGPSGSWGHSLLVPTKKLGNEIAARLNTAFSDGMTWGEIHKDNKPE